MSNPPDEIVLAFTPSRNISDWGLSSDGDHNWYYHQRTRFYCMAHGAPEPGGFTNCSKRNVGAEPYYDLVAKQIVPAPRVYITHYPKKGEWETHKTIDDVIKSNLYIKG